jgi:hypothetical protein
MMNTLFCETLAQYMLCKTVSRKNVRKNGPILKNKKNENTAY